MTGLRTIEGSTQATPPRPGPHDGGVDTGVTVGFAAILADRTVSCLCVRVNRLIALLLSTVAGAVLTLLLWTPFDRDPEHEPVFGTVIAFGVRF